MSVKEPSTRLLVRCPDCRAWFGEPCPDGEVHAGRTKAAQEHLRIAGFFAKHDRDPWITKADLCAVTYSLVQMDGEEITDGELLDTVLDFMNYLEVRYFIQGGEDHA